MKSLIAKAWKSMLTGLILFALVAAMLGVAIGYGIGKAAGTEPPQAGTRLATLREPGHTSPSFATAAAGGLVRYSCAYGNNLVVKKTEHWASGTNFRAELEAACPTLLIDCPEYSYNWRRQQPIFQARVKAELSVAMLIDWADSCNRRALFRENRDNRGELLHVYFICQTGTSRGSLHRGDLLRAGELIPLSARQAIYRQTCRVADSVDYFPSSSPPPKAAPVSPASPDGTTTPSQTPDPSPSSPTAIAVSPVRKIGGITPLYGADVPRLVVVNNPSLFLHGRQTIAQIGHSCYGYGGDRASFAWGIDYSANPVVYGPSPALREAICRQVIAAETERIGWCAAQPTAATRGNLYIYQSQAGLYSSWRVSAVLRIISETCVLNHKQVIAEGACLTRYSLKAGDLITFEISEATKRKWHTAASTLSLAMDSAIADFWHDTKGCTDTLDLTSRPR